MMRKIIAQVTGILAAATLPFNPGLLILFLLGIRPYVVRSGSMEPDIPVGSLCFVNQRISYMEIKVGDLAAYRSALGERVLHRVIAVTDEGLVTKGDANGRSDGITVRKENYIGKEAFNIPKLGYLFGGLETGRGKILGLTAIACLVILSLFFGNERKELTGGETTISNREEVKEI